MDSSVTSPQARRNLIFDIETNGLLPELHTVHCLNIIDADTEEIFEFANAPGYTPVAQGIALLEAAEQIIGHNICAFDIQAIRKLYPGALSRFSWLSGDRKFFDTFLMSRLIWPEIVNDDQEQFGVFEKRRLDGKVQNVLVGWKEGFPPSACGGHGLEPWGYRLGLLKGDYSKEMKAKGLDPWAAWNPDMQAYCVIDVKVTLALYRRILACNYSPQAIELEHAFAEIIQKQVEHGFPIDVSAGYALQKELTTRAAAIEDELKTYFPPWTVYEWFIPKRDNAKKGYQKLVPFKKAKLKVFNPGSRMQIEDRLRTVFGWRPSVYTNEKRLRAQITETILEELPYPPAKLLAELLVIQKLLGQLATGRNAWLKLARNGRVHGEVVTNGAVTGRCTHKTPNLAQVPRVGSPFGRECRSLFVAPEDWTLVGCDAKGLEVRCLGHFLHRYDGGDFVVIILTKDPYELARRWCGLPTRTKGKTFQLAYIYGAGDPELARIAEITGTEQQKAYAGRKLRRKFERNFPAIGRLTTKVKQRAKAAGFLIGLDGRKLTIRKQHAALNTLLQSAGALVMKLATILFYRMVADAGFRFGRDYALVAHIHDEMQILARDEIAKRIGEIAARSIALAGEAFGFRCPLEGEFKLGKNWAETH